MNFKAFTKYDIYTFDASQYSSIVNNVKKSKGFLCYADSKNKQGKVNTRFENYLNEKRQMYLLFHPKKDNTNHDYVSRSVLSNSAVSKNRLKTLYDQHGVSNDYEMEKQISYNEGGLSISTNLIYLEEEKMLEDAKVVSECFERIDNAYMSGFFNESEKTRFLLLPFLSTYKGEKVTPHVIATVYKSGVITVQTVIIMNEEELQAPQEPPITLYFENVEFYETNKEYTLNNLWLKRKKNVATVYDIHEHYHSFLSTITQAILTTDKNQSHYSWVIADFNFKKNKGFENFLNDNKQTLVGYLKNTVPDVTERYSKDNLEKIFSDTLIEQTNAYGFYCAKQGALLIYGTNMLLPSIEKQLEPYREQLKKEVLYDQEVLEFAQTMVFHAMFEYLRFYELTLVKKFFAKTILEGLSKSVYKKVKDFSKVKNDLNMLEVTYNDNLIFQAEGSPKEMYKTLLERSGANETVEVIEKIIKNSKESISEQRDSSIKSSDLYTTILTSFLALIFGFAGLKSFVDNAIARIPIYFISNFVSNHPYRTTFGLWLILLIVLGWLNFNKIRSYQK